MSKHGEYTRNPLWLQAREIIGNAKPVRLEYAEVGECKITLDLSVVRSLFKYMDFYKGTVLDEDFKITGVREATQEEFMGRF